MRNSLSILLIGLATLLAGCALPTSSPDVDSPLGVEITHPDGDEVCIFVGSSLYFAGEDRGPGLHSWVWRRDGDFFSEDSLETSDLTFDQVGTFQIEVEVSDEDGNVATDQITVVVKPMAVYIHPALEPIEINAGQAVDFSSTYDGPAPSTYAWDFGDGMTTSDLADPDPVTYDSPGSYTVTLTGTTADGMSATATRTVMVASTDPGLQVVDLAITQPHDIAIAPAGFMHGEAGWVSFDGGTALVDLDTGAEIPSVFRSPGPVLNTAIFSRSTSWGRVDGVLQGANPGGMITSNNPQNGGWGLTGILSTGTTSSVMPFGSGDGAVAVDFSTGDVLRTVWLNPNEQQHPGWFGIEYPYMRPALPSGEDVLLAAMECGECEVHLGTDGRPGKIYSVVSWSNNPQPQFITDSCDVPQEIDVVNSVGVVVCRESTEARVWFGDGTAMGLDVGLGAVGVDIMGLTDGWVQIAAATEDGRITLADANSNGSVLQNVRFSYFDLPTAVRDVAWRDEDRVVVLGGDDSEAWIAKMGRVRFGK